MKRTMIWLVILMMLVTVLPGALPAARAYDDAHTHQWSQWYPEFSATCDSSGQEYHYCEQCYTYEYRNYPPALGHNFQFVVRDQPSCTTPGYGIDTCTRCGINRDNGRPIDALGHNYQRSVTQQPTCTSNGMAVYTCSRCGDAYREPIPAGNHKWGPWQPGDPATCVQHGTRYHDCTRCGAREWERDYTTDLGDHDWGEWVTVKKPTATEPGLEERTCKVDASHKEQRDIPALGAGEIHPSLELRDAYLSKEKSLPEDGVIPYNWKYAVTGVWNTVNTGDVTLDVKHYLKVGNGREYEIPPLMTLAPGESKPAGSYGISDVGSSSWFTPGSETEELAGIVELTYWATGHDPETGEELCKSKELVFTLKVTKPTTGTEPNPKAWLSITWVKDAGKGKCVEGAIVTVQLTITNIGNVPIIAGKTSDTLQPGEDTTWDYIATVDADEVSKQMLEIQSQWAFKDLDGKTFHTNKADVSIPLTYPDGTTPPEPAPSVKIEMVPENAFKEVYPHDGGVISKSEEVIFYIDATNTGNVPLDLYITWMDSAEHNTHFESICGGKYTKVGAKKSSSWRWRMHSKAVTPEPEDSPYFGSRTMEWYVVGYEPGADPNTAKPLCESNHITRTIKIARPEAEDWTLPEDGLVKKFIKTEESHPSDPNGYQVGERIIYDIFLEYSYPTKKMEEREGYTDLVFEDLNAYDAYNEELNQNGHLHYETEPGIAYGAAWHGAYHIVTPEDAESGYVTNTATAKFTDSVTGEPVEMTTNTVTSPVLGKSKTLLVNKALAKPPANGEYYEEGEEIEYTIIIRNNTDKTYTNIEVKDGGGVIATIDKLEPGQSSDPIHYSGGMVTALDKTFLVIMNVATVTATDENGNKEIITSTEVSAPTDPDGGTDYKPDPEKGNDPMGKIDGVVAGVYVSKMETSAPANSLWYEEGESITYAITVKNTGEVEATNIVVRDSLEKAGLGVIETIPSLAPGESKSIAYQHTVTADDVGHGVVINYATATWQYDGKNGVPVTSEKVKSYTSEEGLTTGVTGGIVPPVKEDDTTPKLDPDGEIIDDSTGTPIYVHADGSYVSCMLDIGSACDAAAIYTLRHCREHEAVAKAAAELLEGNEDSAEAWNAVASLWLDAVEKAYQELYDAAWGDAAGALLLAHDRFMAELQYETELLFTTGDQIAACRRITEILRLHCTELCHILHGGAPTDSLTNAYAELGGVEPSETCERSIGEGSAESPYLERYCASHAEIMAALQANLAHSQSNVANANSFGTGASMWQKALDTQVNAKYKAADADGKKLIAKTRKGLDLYRQALRPLYEILYPENLAAPEEAVLRLYRTMAVDLCELWK